MPIHLPQRPGEPPCVWRGPPPQQLTQTASRHWGRRVLDQRARALCGVRAGASHTCPGSRAYHLAPELARGPAEAFLARTEFAHLHPAYDGSVHLRLPPDEDATACGSGWAVRLPRAGLLLFGPRDEQETGIVWHLLLRAYDFACHGHAASSAADRPCTKLRTSPWSE